MSHKNKFSQFGANQKNLSLKNEKRAQNALFMKTNFSDTFTNPSADLGLHVPGPSRNRDASAGRVLM